MLVGTFMLHINYQANRADTTVEQLPYSVEKEIGLPAFKSVNPNKPIQEQMSTWRMAGRMFKMPTVYIQSHLQDDVEERDGINLLYVYPNFTSRADFANKDEYEKAKNDRRFGHMLLRPSNGRPGFDAMIENRRRGLAREEDGGKWDGLERYNWFRIRGDRTILFYEIYIERNEAGRIKSFIDCAAQERPSARYPGCTHRFRDNGLLYSIYYNKKKYLNDWREQRERAIRFIDEFENRQ